MSSAADDGLTRKQRKNRRARARKKEKKKDAAAALKSAPETEVEEDAVTAAPPPPPPSSSLPSLSPPPPPSYEINVTEKDGVECMSIPESPRKITPLLIDDEEIKVECDEEDEKELSDIADATSLFGGLGAGGEGSSGLALPVAGPGDRSQTPPASHAATRADRIDDGIVRGTGPSNSRGKTPPATHSTSVAIGRENTPPASHASNTSSVENAEDANCTESKDSERNFTQTNEQQRDNGDDGEEEERELDESSNLRVEDEGSEPEELIFEDLDEEGQIYCLTTLLRLARRMDGLEKAVMKELVLQHDKALVTAAIVESSPAALVSRVLDRVMEAATECAYEDWTYIFSGLSDQDAKRLAKDGVQQLRDSTAERGRSLTYGEVDFFSFTMILETAMNEGADNKERKLFVDIGHGTGRAVLAAALLNGHRFRECRGIEILKPLVDASIEAKERYMARTAQRQEFYGHPNDSNARAFVEMMHGDILAPSRKGGDVANGSGLSDGEWTDGDIVFANSTCFSQDLMDKISEKAAELRSGAIIITLTQQLRNPELILMKSRQFAMSWGAATAYFHRRI